MKTAKWSDMISSSCSKNNPNEASSHEIEVDQRKESYNNEADTELMNT